MLILPINEPKFWGPCQKKPIIFQYWKRQRKCKHLILSLSGGVSLKGCLFEKHISFCSCSIIDVLSYFDNYLALWSPYACNIYIHFVGLSHKNSGSSNPLRQLDLILCLQVHGTVSRPTLHITISILVATHSKLNLSSSKQLSFWAICITMLFGLLWKSHLLPGPNTVQKWQRLLLLSVKSLAHKFDFF